MVQVFWDIIPCKSLNSYRRFGETLCLHLQGLAVQDVHSSTYTHLVHWPMRHITIRDHKAT